MEPAAGHWQKGDGGNLKMLGWRAAMPSVLSAVFVLLLFQSHTVVQLVGCESTGILKADNCCSYSVQGSSQVLADLRIVSNHILYHSDGEGRPQWYSGRSKQEKSVEKKAAS